MTRHVLWLFLLALVLRVPHVGGPLRWEERDLVPGLRDISLVPWRFWIPPKVGDHTPLAVVASAPLFRLAPHSPWVLRLPSVLAGAGLAALLAWAVIRAVGTTAGVMTGILVASNNFLIAWSAYFMQEMLYLFFAASGFVAFAHAASSRTTPSLFLSALLFALAFWTHEFALLCAPMAFLALLADPSTRGWLRRPALWCAGLLWAVLVAPYAVWNLLLRDQFASFGGMSIAQQHLAATILAHRRVNTRFLEFFLCGGLRDRPWMHLELNHVEPVVGAVLLVCAGRALLRLRHPVLRLCAIVFWATVVLFTFVDLDFRIYRFSLCLLPGCVAAGMTLARMWQARFPLRAVAASLLAYALAGSLFLRPYAAGAAHQGFRLGGRGPLFSERPLIDLVVQAQRASPASVVVIPAPFWDHVPLHAEYEAGVRCVGGSRETIYSSTYWMRPYGPREAERPRIVLTPWEDEGAWGDFLSRAGYEATTVRQTLQFRGILEDTVVVCPLTIIDAHSASPLPVQAFIQRVYGRGEGPRGSPHRVSPRTAR